MFIKRTHTQTQADTWSHHIKHDVICEMFVFMYLFIFEMTSYFYINIFSLECKHFRIFLFIFSKPIFIEHMELHM